MISNQVASILVGGALLIHGIAHAVALVWLVIQGIRGSSDTRLTARTWILPSLAPKVAAIIALPFWLLSTIGFVGSALSFWEILTIDQAWSQMAVTAAVVSMLGIAAFPGRWPGAQDRPRSVLNASIAVLVNLVILVALLLLDWPPQGMFES